MIIYLLNIALMFFWQFFFFKSKGGKGVTNGKKAFCIVVSIQWILISGLRGVYVGADTYNYLKAFESVKSSSWDSLISACWNYLFHGLEIKDPGYALLTKVFQIFSGSYQMWLIFIAVVFMAPMGRWIYKYSSMPLLSFIIFSTLFYSFYAITGHRQTLATALVVFIGYDFIKEKKFIPVILLSFIAYMIHKSSVVYILYFAIANIKIRGMYVTIVIAIAATILLLGRNFYGQVALRLGFTEEAINSGHSYGKTFVFFMLLICATSFLLYKNISSNRPDSHFLYNAMFLTTLSTFLVTQNQGFMRIQQYYSLFIMLIIPEIVQALHPRERTLAYMIGSGLLIYMLIQNNPQYMFFWQ